MKTLQEENEQGLVVCTEAAPHSPLFLFVLHYKKRTTPFILVLLGK
jgi:hypothetical protein